MLERVHGTFLRLNSPPTPPKLASSYQNKILDRRLALCTSQRGFTILELVIATAVFGVVITGLTAGIQNLIAINNRSRDLSLTNLLAENKAEQLRSAGFNSLTIGEVDFSNELPTQLASPKAAKYTVTSPSPGITEVTITISYRDYQSTREQTYKTMISELGVGQ